MLLRLHGESPSPGLPRRGRQQDACPSCISHCPPAISGPYRRHACPRPAQHCAAGLPRPSDFPARSHDVTVTVRVTGGPAVRPGWAVDQ
jgi:hypothetical protein